MWSTPENCNRIGKTHLKLCGLSEELEGRDGTTGGRGVFGLTNKYEISEKLTIKSVRSIKIKSLVRNLRTAQAT